MKPNDQFTKKKHHFNLKRQIFQFQVYIEWYQNCVHGNLFRQFLKNANSECYT